MLDRRQGLSIVADAYLPSCSSFSSRSGFIYNWKISQGGVDVIGNSLQSSLSTFTISPGSLTAYKVYDISLTVTASKAGRGVTNVVHVNVITSVTANILGTDFTLCIYIHKLNRILNYYRRQ